MCAFPLPSMTKILRTICYLCAPPPSLSSNPSRWKLWTLSRTHILAHGQARRRLRSRPGPMAHALPLSYLSLAGQWAPRTQAHMTPFCALPVLSAQSQRVQASLKTWHRRNRTFAVLGGTHQVLCYANFTAIRWRCHIPSTRMTPGFVWGAHLAVSKTQSHRGKTITPRSYRNEL